MAHEEAEHADLVVHSRCIINSLSSTNYYQPLAEPPEINYAVYCCPKGCLKKNSIRRKLHPDEDGVIQQVQTEYTANEFHL